MNFGHITGPDQLPAAWRVPGGYPYLNQLDSFWQLALNTAHALLRQHELKSPRATYYQDNFRDDFIAAVELDGFARPLHLLSSIEVDNDQMRFGAQPNCWTAKKLLKERLAISARGTYVHVRVKSGDAHWWGVLLSKGGGTVAGSCDTGRRSDKPFTELEITTFALGYESYLARQQAEHENCWISNYSTIRQLSVRPGIKLHAIEMSVNYKRRNVNFTIEQITDRGEIAFSDGTYRGGKSRVQGQMQALHVRPEHVRPHASVKSTPTVSQMLITV